MSYRKPTQFQRGDVIVVRHSLGSLAVVTGLPTVKNPRYCVVGSHFVYPIDEDQMILAKLKPANIKIIQKNRSGQWDELMSLLKTAQNTLTQEEIQSLYKENHSV